MFAAIKTGHFAGALIFRFYRIRKKKEKSLPYSLSIIPFVCQSLYFCPISNALLVYGHFSFLLASIQISTNYISKWAKLIHINAPVDLFNNLFMVCISSLAQPFAFKKFPNFQDTRSSEANVIFCNDGNSRDELWDRIRMKRDHQIDSWTEYSNKWLRYNHSKFKSLKMWDEEKKTRMLK